jgi:aspartyl/asparaginyl beta-hydroxylase (cupin superfamily)
MLTDASGMAAWIAAIPFEAWPQQRRLADGLIRPSMVTDPAWFGFGKQAEPIVSALLEHYPGCAAYQQMLSAVMPGHHIAPHRDLQAPYWLTRVHVPLMTNDRSLFIVDGKPIHMEIGRAYEVDTLAIHSVENGGDCPRIHFMFDVRKA